MKFFEIDFKSFMVGFVITLLVAVLILMPVTASRNRGYPIIVLKKDMVYTQGNTADYLFLREGESPILRIYFIEGLNKDNLPLKFINTGKTEQGYKIVPYEPTVPK